MAKLIFEATGLTVEVPTERVEQMKRHGFKEIKPAQSQTKTGAKNGSKSK